MIKRLKFEITPLINEMLDALPKEIWQSTTTTFLDPSMGGGQFVAAIEARLKAHGHSTSDIKDRVFGFEKNKLRVNYAVNNKQLVGTYRVADFLEEPMEKKFDVIVGNPPFKNGNEVGGKSSLWRKIVSTAFPLVEDGGYMVFITPQFSNSAADIGHVFTKNQTLIVWTQISKYFPGVGSSFYAWMVNKVPKTMGTFFIDEKVHIDISNKALPKDIKCIGLVEKVMNNDCFKCLSSPEYLHTSVADGKDEKHLSVKKSGNLIYKIRRTSGENYCMWGDVQPTDYFANKVVMTFSGNPHYQYHNKSDPIGTIKFQSGYIKVKNKTEATHLIELYNSKLYRLIQQQIGSSGGMKGKNIYSLPLLDLTRSWTDKELYKHFKLTKEEIAYVEANVQ